jgi:hypothetical protein
VSHGVCWWDGVNVNVERCPCWFGQPTVAE